MSKIEIEVESASREATPLTSVTLVIDGVEIGFYCPINTTPSGANLQETGRFNYRGINPHPWIGNLQKVIATAVAVLKDRRSRANMKEAQYELFV